MSKISLKHSGGNVVSLNSPTNAPSAADVAFKLPNADGSDGQAIVTDGSGNLSFGSVAATRNLIINGAMQVAQRGTSTTAASGYTTLDRFSQSASNLDNNCDVEQATISSGGAYDAGFRTSYKVTNGDNTAGSNDQSKINQTIESQNLACSGWNSTNSNSKVTLSFWVKSSVAQTFVVHMYADDVNKRYAFEYAATTSWTKITHTITGASGLTFNNDNGLGISLQWYLYMGTDTTDNSFTYNAWASYSGSSRARDMTTTWQTTNDATFEITGVQLEVGSVATDFQHRSYADELRSCQRYFWSAINANHSGDEGAYLVQGTYYGNSKMTTHWYHPETMRTNPTVSFATGTNYYNIYRADGSDTFNSLGSVLAPTAKSQTRFTLLEINSNVSGTGGHSGIVGASNTAVYIHFSAEL